MLDFAGVLGWFKFLDKIPNVHDPTNPLHTSSPEQQDAQKAFLIEKRKNFLIRKELEDYNNKAKEAKEKEKAEEKIRKHSQLLQLLNEPAERPEAREKKKAKKEIQQLSELLNKP